VTDLTDLYREVILDHNRHPRNFGRLDPHDAHADGHNPLCGDRVSITLRRNGDKLEDLRFEVSCAISVASASLMTEAVKGKDRAAIAGLFSACNLLTELARAPPTPVPPTSASWRRCPGCAVSARGSAPACAGTLNAALAQHDATGNASVSTGSGNGRITTNPSSSSEVGRMVPSVHAIKLQPGWRVHQPGPGRQHACTSKATCRLPAPTRTPSARKSCRRRNCRPMPRKTMCASWPAADARLL
jgi:nitrogen fixation NifU-like protein